jgi:hypothetical protein
MGQSLPIINPVLLMANLLYFLQFVDNKGDNNLGKNIYYKFSIVLKLLAKIFGVILISYGCAVGLLGVGPDGPVVPIRWRFIGLFSLFQGLFYLISNTKLMKTNRTIISYLSITFSPAIMILFFIFYTVATRKMEAFIESNGLVTVVFLLPISMFAPLSLIFTVIGQKRSRKN